jgi:hypothetical protein
MGLKNVFSGSVAPTVARSRNIPQKQDGMEFVKRWEAFCQAIRDRFTELNMGAQGYELRFSNEGRTFNTVHIINTDTHNRFPLCFVHKGTPGRDGEGARYEGYIFKAASEVAPYAPATIKNPKTGAEKDNTLTRSAEGSIWSDTYGMDALKSNLQGCASQR